MDDLLLLDAAERYLKGEMSPQEKAYFEELRKTTPEIDQMVVEHSMFLLQINAFGENRDFKHSLHTVHNNLIQTGDIKESSAATGGKVIRLWKKYKRVTAIAASIAGVTAIVMSGLVTYFTPVSSKNELRDLKRSVAILNHNIKVQSNQINEIKSKAPANAQPGNGGTSFLIDGKGFLVTNAHVVKGASTIIVQNTKGQEFKATISHLDNLKDLAILKIEDVDFKPYASLPYSIRRNTVDLGEQIFTLGYPRDEIVYNEGYMSAKTGYNGDTISCQIAVSANPGNSGGPVLNRNGEVIGVLSTAQQNAEGVVFAIKSKNIFQVMNDLKEKGLDTSFAKVKLPTASNIRGLDRVQQIKKIEDCIFMVKTFTTK
ncbi:MAG: trypsin-like peptidase protein [Segetibacter sp.]|nr:trypsin-like peptidase protein [Segetibacter sp.]